VKFLHIPELLPSPIPHAREYQRAAVVLAIATAFKLLLVTFGVVTFIDIHLPDAVGAGIILGAPILDLGFIALAVHWRVETLGGTLGALMFLLDLVGAVVPVIPFANPGYTGGAGTLLAAMCVIYTLSFAAGVTGTSLLRRNARRASEVETG
jgi:hypothetical protein